MGKLTDRLQGLFKRGNNDVQQQDNPKHKQNLQSCILRGPDSAEAIRGFFMDPNHPPYTDALPWAVQAKKYNIAKSLIKEHQFDVNDYFKGSRLFKISHNLPIYGVKPNHRSDLLSQAKAMTQGNFGSTNLLKTGFVHDSGVTALHGDSILSQAIREGNDIAMIKLLLDSSSLENLNIKFTDMQGNILHDIMYSAVNCSQYDSTHNGQKMLDIITLLLKAGLEVNAQDSSGDTALHSVICALQGNYKAHPIDEHAIKIFKLLLDYKADPAAQNNNKISLESFLEEREKNGETKAVDEIRAYIRQKNTIVKWPNIF